MELGTKKSVSIEIWLKYLVSHLMEPVIEPRKVFLLILCGDLLIIS